MQMDSSFLLAILAAAICSFKISRKFRFHQENKEIDSSSSLSPPSSVPPSSLTPSSSVVLSSSSHNWTHQVFPSFRGEDVRRDFLSHIQKEFQRKGITPFVDNEIKRGESIAPELIRAIRGSKIAIILLSRNYASSNWCLDELVEIMKCKEEISQTVMAIFYKVDPSDVKKLTGDFGKVFSKTCVGKSKEDIKRWKEALRKVATIAGYHSINWDNEAAMVEKIAIDVSNVLINSTPSRDFDGLIGMGAHMENIASLLHLDSDKVKMIGIWGPSGIGKSTIARVLFSKYSHQFQLCVFMENIKRRYPRPCHDVYSAKLQLQNAFLSQIINQEDIKIHHLGVAQDRLKDKRVFVVLDDVDQLAQLEAMAGKTMWFGLGSRIIVTTQDKRLLKAHGIDQIYEVGFPHDDEALKIFCMYAFGQESPYDGFETLACEVTKLSGKLPLGLRVMGSYFRGMSKHEWGKELPRLRNSLDGEIESILKFSYDALRDEDKDLFLYIACFFNDEQIEKVESYLAENFVDVRQGLHVLAEKSLISISSGYIWMHNLLARLGGVIDRKQSIHDIAHRRFLVGARDICQVLSNDITVSRSVVGIDSSQSMIEVDFHISDRDFERMYSLQFLRIAGRYQKVPRSYLPQKLKLLFWVYFPEKCLPSNFNPEFLIEISMPYSNLEKLWEGIQTIRNLKWMNLNYCSELKELPNLSTATNLQELNLPGCSSLVELPSSIGNVINLKILDLNYCSSLLELPSSIGNLHSLLTLYLNGCSKLVSLPQLPESLETLDAESCESLERLDSSFHNTEFDSLDFGNCFKLNQEARDLIMTSAFKNAYLPGEKVPTYFTSRVIGSSLSMTLNGIDMHLPRFLRFKACLLLVNKGDSEVHHMDVPNYFIQVKLNGIDVQHEPLRDPWRSKLFNEHLYIIGIQEEVSSSELFFEFGLDDTNWDIGECGINFVSNP